jgi:hypothetical protein
MGRMVTRLLFRGPHEPSSACPACDGAATVPRGMTIEEPYPCAPPRVRSGSRAGRIPSSWLRSRTPGPAVVARRLQQRSSPLESRGYRTRSLRMDPFMGRTRSRPRHLTPPAGIRCSRLRDSRKLSASFAPVCGTTSLRKRAGSTRTPSTNGSAGERDAMTSLPILDLPNFPRRYARPARKLERARRLK